jgi:hypothetical protein
VPCYKAFKADFFRSLLSRALSKTMQIYSTNFRDRRTSARRKMPAGLAAGESHSHRLPPDCWP